jgi:zinc transport system substrate-binding protein
MRFLKIAAIFLTMVFMLSGCDSQQASKMASNDKIKVVTSVYPVYEFTKQVGKDKIDLSMLAPLGSDPHDFEPTPKEIISLKSADIFIYHGADLEPWIENLNIKDTGVTIVEASKNITLLNFSGKHSHSHGADHKIDTHDVDPHVWLDPERAMIEVNNIAEALSEKDPKNADFYRENAKIYNTKLAKLDEEFLANKDFFQGKELVTNHAAFGYLANKYGFEQIAVMGLTHDAEATPERVAVISDLCKKHKIKYIFTESVVNTKLTEMIAKEVGAETLILNPLDVLSKEEYDQGRDYLSIMQENLNNLKKAFVK